MREEIGKDKFRIKTGRRAVGKKLEEGKGESLARKCYEEMKNRVREGRERSEWKEERVKFFEDKGMGGKKMEEKRGKGEEVDEGWEQKDRER